MQDQGKSASTCMDEVVKFETGRIFFRRKCGGCCGVFMRAVSYKLVYSCNHILLALFSTCWYTTVSMTLYLWSTSLQYTVQFTVHCIVYSKLLSLTQATTSWCIQTAAAILYCWLCLVYAMVVTSSEGCFMNIIGLYDFSEVCPIYQHTCVNCRVNVFMLTGIQHLPFLGTYRIA